MKTTITLVNSHGDMFYDPSTGFVYKQDDKGMLTPNIYDNKKQKPKEKVKK